MLLLQTFLLLLLFFLVLQHFQGPSHVVPPFPLLLLLFRKASAAVVVRLLVLAEVPIEEGGIGNWEGILFLRRRRRWCTEWKERLGRNGEKWCRRCILGCFLSRRKFGTLSVARTEFFKVSLSPTVIRGLRIGATDENEIDEKYVFKINWPGITSPPNCGITRRLLFLLFHNALLSLCSWQQSGGGVGTRKIF